MNSTLPALPCWLRLARVGLLMLPLSLIGCRGAQGDNRSDAERRLQTIAQAFTRYAGANKGATPTDEKALKAFINGLSAPEKEGMKITDVDELFISPRDQKPFKV